MDEPRHMHNLLMCHVIYIHICVTWLIDIYDMTHLYRGYDALILVTWLIDMCDMTHSYVWRDWSKCHICVSSHSHTHTLTRTHKCTHTHTHTYAHTHTHTRTREPHRATLVFILICDTICDMTHWYMWRDWSKYVTWLVFRTDSVCLICCGVATISRLLKMIGLFCRILSLLWVSFAKETYHFKEPTNRSHPMCDFSTVCVRVYVCVCVRERETVCA